LLQWRLLLATSPWQILSHYRGNNHKLAKPLNPKPSCINLLLISQNYKNTLSSFLWDQSLHGNLALLSSQYHYLIYIYPDLPNLLHYANSKYALSSQEPHLDQAPDKSSLLGDLDNLIGGCDGPTECSHSHLVKTPSATQELGLLATEKDTAEFHDVPSTSQGASTKSARISRWLDGSVSFEDSMNYEPLFQSPQSPDETSDEAPLDYFYSTPFSWERPELGCQVENAFSYPPLSPEEESRLLSIAMPAQPNIITPPFSPSPEPRDTRKSRKRKSSESSESGFSPPPHSRHLRSQKKAHNKIERRYRTNINDKIAALRDCVPSLRVVVKDNPCGEDRQEHLQGLMPAQKLNKVFNHFDSLFCILTSSTLSFSPIQFVG
jgi:hypothetical protein